MHYMTLFHFVSFSFWFFFGFLQIILMMSVSMNWNEMMSLMMMIIRSNKIKTKYSFFNGSSAPHHITIITFEAGFVFFFAAASLLVPMMGLNQKNLLFPCIRFLFCFLFFHLKGTQLTDITFFCFNLLEVHAARIF